MVQFPKSWEKSVCHKVLTLIARFMGPIWGPPWADRTQVAPMLAPCTLLSGDHSFLSKTAPRKIGQNKESQVWHSLHSFILITWYVIIFQHSAVMLWMIFSNSIKSNCHVVVSVLQCPTIMNNIIPKVYGITIILIEKLTDDSLVT